MAAGDVYTMWRLKKAGTLRGARVPDVDFEQERVAGNAILALHAAHAAEWWVRDVGKGGVFKRLIEFFAQPDRNVQWGDDVPDRIEDVLLGEGPLNYLCFVPDGADVDVEGPLGARRIATVQPGSGLLCGSFGEIDLMAFRNRAETSLEPFWSEPVVTTNA